MYWLSYQGSEILQIRCFIISPSPCFYTCVCILLFILTANGFYPVEVALPFSPALATLLRQMWWNKIYQTVKHFVLFWVPSGLSWLFAPFVVFPFLRSVCTEILNLAFGLSCLGWTTVAENWGGCYRVVVSYSCSPPIRIVAMHTQYNPVLLITILNVCPTWRIPPTEVQENGLD